ncbi:coiled-coil domain-containing protein 158 isoform X3 [Syngnathus scovelli]|uniref:coiled-coil domain-containing protein 158 isoform X3 n=1 Tax=Syngnathus scovelli TaxID=161590 RepID=UPI0021108649|nr:coiled-coil domain-containing protein 158 isoform X3 [Syngnathus scovelli]
MFNIHMSHMSHTCDIASRHDMMALHREDPAAATRDVSGLRFNSLALDELSEQLERCTAETQKLQEEVGHATKAALEKFACESKSISDPSLDSLTHQQCQRDVRPRRKNAQEIEDVMHLSEHPVEQVVRHRDPRNGQNGRMEELITSIGQEVEMLNHKLSSSKDSGHRINTKLELLRTSLQQQQLTSDLVRCRSQEVVQTPGGVQEASDRETKRPLCQLDEALSRHGTLLAEKETLRLELKDRDKLVETLRFQLEKSKLTIDDLHRENALLGTQMNQLKVGHAESLVNQRLAITEELTKLQPLRSCTCHEHRDVVQRLRRRLKSTQTELDQVRGAMRTLEGGRANALQARVQHLEETLEKVNQERSYQNAESQRQTRELAFVREEKRQLACELDAVRSKDKHLRERISELEAILHKMTESFANCQEFIQLKEQEFFRLKLKHILDLKEYQGENVTPPGLDSLIPSAALADPRPSTRDARNARITQENRARDRLPQNLEEPHADNAGLRRRSAPARTHRPAFGEQSKAARRRTTCGSKTTTETTESHNRSCSMTATRHTFYPWRRASDCKSPVYALLTSDPGHN